MTARVPLPGGVLLAGFVACAAIGCRPAASPDAGLASLGSKHGDVRAAALVRFFGRDHLRFPA